MHFFSHRGGAFRHTLQSTLVFKFHSQKKEKNSQNRHSVLTSLLWCERVKGCCVQTDVNQYSNAGGLQPPHSVFSWRGRDRPLGQLSLAYTGSSAGQKGGLCKAVYMIVYVYMCVVISWSLQTVHRVELQGWKCCGSWWLSSAHPAHSCTCVRWWCRRAFLLLRLRLLLPPSLPPYRPGMDGHLAETFY